MDFKPVPQGSGVGTVFVVVWVFFPSHYLPWLRYFTLFMNLLNDCSEPEDDTQQVAGRKRGMSRRLASLRHCTVLAMSNLLNANVDSGLMHSIGEHRRSRHHPISALLLNSWCKRNLCLGVNCNDLKGVVPAEKTWENQCELTVWWFTAQELLTE